MVERRRTAPRSTITAQRPQRPWPPQGWAICSPACWMASATRVPVGTWAVACAGSSLTVCAFMGGSAAQRSRYTETVAGDECSFLPHRLEVSGDVHRFPRADHDLPTGQLLFQLAGQHRHLARDDQALVPDFFGHPEALDRLSASFGLELARRPGGEHAHALGV